LQPEANDVGALLAILWPALRKAVIDHVIVLDTEGVLDDLGGASPSSQLIACLSTFAISALSQRRG
jgi:hypothetical protein